MNGPPDAERRRQGEHPDTGDVLSTSSSTTVRRRGAVVPYVEHRRAVDSDARLAGELAAARVAVLAPLTLTPRCECQAASIDWLRWAGAAYGGCPHVGDGAA